MPVPHYSVFTGQMPFPLPNQQCQSTEGRCIEGSDVNEPKGKWKSQTNATQKYFQNV